MKVLFVCLGNICRSPLAEGILQHKAKQAKHDWIIESAGTSGYHTGEAPHPLSIKVARLHGIDISKQVSRCFRKEDIDSYDLIFAMADDVIREIKKICEGRPDERKIKLFLDELYPNESRDVPDPWYGDEDGYHEVYDIIDKGCEAIINKYLPSSTTKVGR